MACVESPTQQQKTHLDICNGYTKGPKDPGERWF